ncbi:restriction endonuclease subunit S [Leptospira noumeaensis]|uniref:Restriction endonuclease subunit S n=1 Tax=Leptospira noumeaensis TaxID=2484964 RepID=A0A4V3JJ88_9LEPT|nr:restriction endonuclease subunit S [Leptospira noumeaensis]TGK79190.1 restriction endonuclease subunit S [Leptospira noumeaensis]
MKQKEKSSRKQLVPNLRFPDFQNAGDWDLDYFENLTFTITPTRKIPSSQYLTAGTFPIVDQSQNFICGWTNNEELIITNQLPLIVFGDHTCIVKLINFPFAQGADGIKIIGVNPSLNTLFLYQYLLYDPVIQEEYKRHFSLLREKFVSFPSLPEQKKIADCLSSLDELIQFQTKKLEVVQSHKKGLLQNLFPAEGETVPRLRFPEFEGTGDWVERKLGEVCVAELREVAKPTERYLGLGIRSHGKGTFQKLEQDPKGNSMDVLYQVHENDLIVSITFAWEGAIAIASREDHGGLVSHRFPTYVFKHEETISNFFRYIITKKSFVYKLGLISPGGAGRNRVMNKKDFHELKEYFSSLPEQQRIADCLSSVDALIQEQLDALEKLKTHKKGLLQGLFPVMGE